MIDKEVAGPRLKGESTLFGFINLPSVFMIKIHKYILLFLGAAIVACDIYIQLPSDLSKLESATIDPNTWLAFPFIFVAYLFGDKQIYIRVCRQFRMIALEEQQEINELELEMMVTRAMCKRAFLGIRLFSAFFIGLTWFVMFNFLMIGMFYFLGA